MKINIKLRNGLDKSGRRERENVFESVAISNK